MHPFFEKLEHFNSRLIPYALVALLIVIILEFAYHTQNPLYHLVLQITDYLIIAIFVVDLIFIAHKCKTVKFFFRNYYLDILAVFPFALAFRLVNEIYLVFRLGREFTLAQSIFHETLEAGKALEAGKTLEAEKELRVLSRTEKLPRYLKIAARSLRLLTKSKFFQRWSPSFILKAVRNLSKRKAASKRKT